MLCRQRTQSEALNATYLCSKLDPAGRGACVETQVVNIVASCWALLGGLLVGSLFVRISALDRMLLGRLLVDALVVNVSGT